MGHEIFANRFFSRNRQPAWHCLMHPTDKEFAREIVADMTPGGIIKLPLYARLPKRGGEIESGYYGLFRTPTPDDPHTVPFGTPVSSEFVVFDGAMAANIVDSFVRNGRKRVPVETLAFLHRGTHMFVTYKLPSIDVAGDETNMFLVIDFPFGPNQSIGVYVTPVRVVCQNTLRMGIDAATEYFQVTHAKGAADVIGNYMSGVYKRALEKTAVLKEALETLSSKRIEDKAQISWVIENTYVLPARPQADSARARKSMDERLAAWESQCERIEKIRKAVTSLTAQGRGTGMNHPAVKGTAYGVYNAVTEYESHGRPGAERLAVMSIFNGERGRRMTDAFTLCANIDRWQTADRLSLGLGKSVDEFERELVPVR